MPPATPASACAIRQRSGRDGAHLVGVIRMDPDVHLRWLEERVVAAERRITRQLEIIRYWRWLGQDTDRLEQQAIRQRSCLSGT